MTIRPFDPRHLDIERFAAEGAALEGRWPTRGFGRLVETTAAGEAPGPDDEVEWRARGERRTARGEEPQTWLRLDASCRLALQCQRCLQPVATDLVAQRELRFVAGEDPAAQLDAECDYDVLASSRALDLHELIEDELLLALPLVPLHEVCHQPLPFANEEEAAADHPFAGLAALKRRDLPN
jgi:uncharacterized protein